MKHIKSRADARAALAAGATPRHVAAALRLLRNYETGYAEYGGWEPEEHGWVVLIEAAAELDDVEALHLGGGLLAALYEGVEDLRDLGCLGVIVIMGNDFGLSYVVPDALLTPAQRAALLANLFPRPTGPAETPAGPTPF